MARSNMFFYGAVLVSVRQQGETAQKGMGNMNSMRYPVSATDGQSFTSEWV